MKHLQIIFAVLLVAFVNFNAQAQKRKPEQTSSAKATYGASPTKSKVKTKKMHASKGKHNIKASKLHARNSKKRYSPVMKG